MARIACDFQRTASTTLSLGTMTADATRPRRLRVYDIMFGSEATPADAALLWTFQRCTAAGTSTGVTPTMIDPGDVATEYDAGENHTIEPTYTATLILLNVPLNQRATYRWVAAPDGELVMPSTAANGFGIQTDTISTGTPVITATVHALEL
jgi:hypothetical protein